MAIRHVAISLGASAAAILCLFTQSATAQTIMFDFAPQVGAAWKVTQTRTQTKAKDGGVPTTGTITSTLRVVGEGRDGYLMEWTTDSVAVENVVIRNQPQMLIGVPVRFDADETGLPIRIHDAQKIIETSLAVIGSENDPNISKARELMMGMEPENLAAMMLKDVALMAQCHDFRLETGVDLSAELQMPNALGGPTIKSNYSVTLEDAGSASTPARIRIKQAYDPESAAASIYETIKNLSGKEVADKNLRDGKLPKLMLQTTTVCHIDRTSGAAVSVVDDKKSSVGDETSSEVRKLIFEPL